MARRSEGAAFQKRPESGSNAKAVDFLGLKIFGSRYSTPMESRSETQARAAIDVILEQCSRESNAEVLDLRVGPYWTVVTSTLGTGMASTMAGHFDRRDGTPVRDAGGLLGMGIGDLVGLLRSPSPPEAAIGLAAVNSLTDAHVEAFSQVNAREILKERGQGKAVAIIGRFPFVDDLRGMCRELWVFEKGNGRRADDLGPEHVADVLPHAEVVGISATTLINHTLDEICRCIDPGAFVIMLGPSTPMMPCLFDLGFDLLCGSVIEDPVSVFTAVEQGAVTRQIPGVRRVALFKAGS